MIEAKSNLLYIINGYRESSPANPLGSHENAFMLLQLEPRDLYVSYISFNYQQCG